MRLKVCFVYIKQTKPLQHANDKFVIFIFKKNKKKEWKWHYELFSAISTVVYLSLVQLWKTHCDYTMRETLNFTQIPDATRHNRTQRSIINHRSCLCEMRIRVSRASTLQTLLIIKGALRSDASRRERAAIKLSIVSLFTCRFHAHVQRANLRLSRSASVNIPQRRQLRRAVKGPASPVKARE